MKIFDLFSMCIRNLVRRKFRTLLTVIGVVIGTASIVIMISLGIAINVQQEEQLKMWGDLTMIEIYNWSGGETIMDDTALEAINNIPGVDVATPFVSLQLNSEYSIYAGRGFKYRYRYPNLYGVYPGSLEKLGFRIKEGEDMPSGKSKTICMVAGGSFAYQFEDTRKKFNNYRSDWPDENGVIEDPFFPPMGSDYKLVLPPVEDEDGKKGQRLEYEFEVVGLLEGERNKWETMYAVFMPLSELEKIQQEYNKENGIKTSKNEKTNYDQVKVKAVDINTVTAIEEAIHNLGFPNTWSMASQREEMQKSTMQMQIILGSLGGITLLVSAISIANTMITSVSERTREIGIMKVLGCLVGNIRSMFLIEAGCIGFFGGVLGVGLSYLLSFLLNFFGGAISNGGGRYGMFGMLGRYSDGASKISIIPPWLVLLGLAFATCVGLIAGFYPANRAVKISALEAIKQE